MNLPLFVIVLIGCFSNSLCYLELSDNFSELRKNGGRWLIKFYAPWCGYCQQLKPVWDEVGEALLHTDVRVGRIDCSHFPSVVSEFRIRGYPTIKFISSDSEYTFLGDRNKEEIVDFAIRVSGPPVRTISEGLDDVKDTSEPFFVYAGEKNGELWETFYEIAKKFISYSYFYATNEQIAREVLNVSETPSVFVYKENEAIYYTGEHKSTEASSLSASLGKWVSEERFLTFQKVARGNLTDLMQLSRYVVITIVDEQKLNENIDMANFKKMMETIIKTNKRKYRKRFIFGWIGDPDFANTIAMEVVPLPYLLVINSTNQYHHIPDADCSKMTAQDVELFLEKIYNQSALSYGGTGIGTRLYRVYFEATMTLGEMWQQHPVVTTGLFIIPMFILFFLLYTLCCINLVDDEVEDEDGNDSDGHEKQD